MKKGVTIIIPYRDRRTQLNKLLDILLRPGVDLNIHAVVIAEQGNTGPFNRGAIKNAGFDAAVADLDLQPNDTICFHDVDVCPETSLTKYPLAAPQTVQHLYGHKHCLGGVFCITVEDFIGIGKFPHWDFWGQEDVMIQRQVEASGITINRRNFTLRFQDMSSSSNGGGDRPGGMFYEIDSNGERESSESLKMQLKEKMDERKRQQGRQQQQARGGNNNQQRTITTPTHTLSTSRYFDHVTMGSIMTRRPKSGKSSIILRHYFIRKS